MAILPEGANLNVVLEYAEQPTHTFLIDWESKQIAGTDAGLAAMRQAVEIMLRNERFSWQIYDSSFGTELEDLPGEEYAYLISELPRRIEEAFSVDNRILSVDNWKFQDIGGGNLLVAFDVTTVFGSFGMEVSV